MFIIKQRIVILSKIISSKQYRNYINQFDCKIKAIHGWKVSQLRTAQVKMAAINLLNKVAELCRYTKFDELQPGRYVISEFFITEDRHFGASKLLAAKISGGRRYVILPKRFGEQIDSTVLASMNTEQIVLNFVGKKSQFELEIRFEAFMEGEVYDIAE